jgi:hypothetical protein
MSIVKKTPDVTVATTGHRLDVDALGIPKEANMQQAAWDLGHDKKLTARLTDALVQDAAHLSAGDFGATVGDFRAEAAAQLEANGVGAADAKGLIDDFVAENFSLPLADGTKLHSALNTVAVRSDAFVRYNDDGSVANTPLSQTIADYAADGHMSDRVYAALLDDMKTFAASTGATSIDAFCPALYTNLVAQGVTRETAMDVVSDFSNRFSRPS